MHRHDDSHNQHLYRQQEYSRIRGDLDRYIQQHIASMELKMMSYRMSMMDGALTIVNPEGQAHTLTLPKWFELAKEALENPPTIEQEPQEPNLDEAISAWSIVRGVKDKLHAMPIEYRADQFRELILLSVAQDSCADTDDECHTIVANYLESRTTHDVARLVTVLEYRDHRRGIPGNLVKNEYMTTLEMCLWDIIYSIRSKQD